MTPCHSQKYAEALRGMRQWASKMWQGSLPPWGQAAIEQHAHYYASRACGEDTMRFNDYAGASLGITRRGTDDGRVLRTISMAGFGAFGAPPPADAAAAGTYTASNWLDEGCIRSSKQPDGTAIKYPGSSYCQCMYGEADRISTENKNSADFRTGSARWACQTAAELNFPPWSDDSILLQILASGGKADPLKSLSLAEKVKAYRTMIQNAGEKEIGIPGLASFKLKDAGGVLENMGLVPRGTMGVTQAVLDIDAYRGQVRARSDKDLVALIEQFQASPPDPASSPENAAIYAAAIEENNFRASNPCPSGQVRTTRFPLDSAGRASCDQIIIRPGLRPGAGIIGLKPLPLPNYLTGGGGGGGGGAKTDKAMPTGLILGGVAAAVAVLFLLKK